MRKEYDFTQSRRNPYAKHFRQQITIRIDKGTIAYFKQLSSETGLPYQHLIDLFLRECALQERRPVMKWLKTG